MADANMPDLRIGVIVKSLRSGGLKVRMNDNDTSDCCLYHAIIKAIDAYSEAHSSVNVDEVIDALNVALIVGGSITIPHVRRAFARMREIPGLKP